MIGARAATVPPAMAHDQLLAHSFEWGLPAGTTSPRTIRKDLAASNSFGTFLAAHGMPTEPTATAREHVEAFIGRRPRGADPSTRIRSGTASRPPGTPSAAIPTSPTKTAASRSAAWGSRQRGQAYRAAGASLGDLSASGLVSTAAIGQCPVCWAEANAPR